MDAEHEQSPFYGPLAEPGTVETNVPASETANQTSTTTVDQEKISFLTKRKGDKPRLNAINEDYDAFEHEDHSQFPDGGLRAWLCVAGSTFGLMSVFGVMNTISSMQLQLQNNQLADTKVSSISWMFSIYMYLNLSLSIISGPLFDTIGIKKVLLPGMILNCAGLYATAYSTKLWHFILSFGFCAGIGSGLMMAPLVSVISHWFLKRRGLADGVAQCGSVMGVAFPLMLRDLYPRLGFQKAMVILASICVFQCIMSFLLVKDRREIIADPEIKDKPFLQRIKNTIDLSSFKEKPFAFLVTGLFFSEFSILLIITYLATYGEARGMSQSTAFILLTVKNSSGLVGGIVPNYLSDYLGRFNVIVIVSTMMSISIFAIWLPYYNDVGLFIFAVVYGFSFMGAYSITPTTIAQISSAKTFGSRYATAYFIIAIGNLISMPVGSQFINKQTIHNYNNMIIFAGCSCVLSTCLLFLARYSIVGFKIKKFV